jgi:hypothetical protein
LQLAASLSSNGRWLGPRGGTLLVAADHDKQSAPQFAMSHANGRATAITSSGDSAPSPVEAPQLSTFSSFPTVTECTLTSGIQPERPVCPAAGFHCGPNRSRLADSCTWSSS